ncbi:MAG: terminase small subunit [Promethearchaeota archaeon]
MSKFKRKDIPKKRIRKNNGNGKKKSIKAKGGNGARKLTFKRLKFIEELLKDPKGNASDAARRAGYALGSAGPQAQYLMKDDRIIKALEKGRRALMATSRIDQEWVLSRLEMLADFCIGDLFNDDGTMKNFSDIPKEALYAIGGFEQSKKILTLKDKSLIEERIKKFKLPDKTKVLDIIGRYLGMFENDNKQRGGPTIVGQNIQVILVD